MDTRRASTVSVSVRALGSDPSSEAVCPDQGFRDGAVAFLLAKGAPNEVLGSHGITDGSLSLQVKVPAGGSVSPNGGYRFLDVADPRAMKDRLDENVAQHQAILDSIERHDGPLARRLMSEHVRHAGELVTRRFEERSG